MTSKCLLFLLVMTGMGFGQTQEFVITGCPKDGTVVRGKDSIFALAGSGVTVWPKQEYDEAKKRFMEYDVKMRPEAEPIDVPAITKEKIVPPGEMYMICDVAGPCRESAIHIVTTCADPKRILQHDEDTPAKFWCHRVQP